jgi:hypothetical protein
MLAPRLLWRLRIEHAYCPDAPQLPQWQFSALGVTPGLRLRRLDDGLALYADAEEAPASERLLLALAAADPLFDNYSTGFDAPAGQVGLRSPDADGLLQPAGFVQALLPGQRLALAMPVVVQEATYRLRIDGRASIWNYLLLGRERSLWGEAPPRVVDPEREFEFAAATDEALADGSTVWAIRSTTAIPLQYRGGARFELRADTASGPDRVLIRRLPVAHARSFGRLDPTGAPVSEILVRP